MNKLIFAFVTFLMFANTFTLYCCLRIAGREERLLEKRLAEGKD